MRPVGKLQVGRKQPIKKIAFYRMQARTKIFQRTKNVKKYGADLAIVRKISGEIFAKKSLKPR